MIDTHVHLGPWPFTPIVEHTPATLVAQLAENGIEEACVSHLGAVFRPDPTPANAELIRLVRRTPTLHPVPIIHPFLANWREQLAAGQREPAVRAVKILPAHHNFRLTPKRLEDFMAALADAGLKLVLGVRLEDERHKYFALRIKGVPMAPIGRFLEHFSAHHILVSGAYLSELEKLAPGHANFSAEIAFCDWYKSVERLLRTFPAERLMLGTGTPLFSTRAGVDKLRRAEISKRLKTSIGQRNARQFFGF
jgi:predicted TIM-barrel fold metal-dependent hydrolase